MARTDNKYIRRSLDAAKELTILADEGEARCRDDGCAVLYGIIRDCAYKIRRHAEDEKSRHRRLGLWEDANQLQ